MVLFRVLTYVLALAGLAVGFGTFALGGSTGGFFFGAVLFAAGAICGVASKILEA